MSNNQTKQKTVKASKLYGDYLVMLVAPIALSVIFYGTRALAVIAVSVLSAVLSDLIFSAFLRKNFLLKDLSNVFIGAAIALMMPAGISLYVPAVASVFAVITAKIPFGGSLRAPFVPAAAGFAFATVCFKEQIFDYSYNSADKLLGNHSLGSLLTQGNAVYLDTINTFDILSGNVAGPMGTGCGLLMLACLVFLAFRRKEALFATAGFIAACVLYAAVFPRINANAFTSVVLELSAGSLLFAAVFLITDYAALPEKRLTRFVYGAVGGVFCMLMRTVGTYEETVCFAVLLANGFSPVIDSVVKKLPSAVKAVPFKRKEAEK
ncbi:MAG: hypothetical protein E7547_07880 [Ruminococcaceae bacterium]|nr:hypothetical protein [Oscillospiraceae bacterium]